MNIVTRSPKFFCALIAFLVLGSLWEMYPLSNRSLIAEFAKRADFNSLDTNFTDITNRAWQLQKDKPDPAREFNDLLDAIGTNDIQKYFPYNNVKSQENPTYALLNILQRKAAGKIHLGLDLQGGTEFRVSLDTNHVSATDTNHAAGNASQERQRLVSQAITILRNRVDSMGVAEPIITPAGENEISIQLPGLSQAAQDEARIKIQKAAFLEFRLVDPDMAEHMHSTPPFIPPGCEILREKTKDASGNTIFVAYIVEKKPANGLTGKYIKRAIANRDPSGEPEVLIDFDKEGGIKFGEFTKAHVGNYMAIVLDGEIQTAPIIKTAIMEGHCSISGAMDLETAISTANMLENPLETPVKIVAMSQVDPTLGKDSIHSGVFSAIAGTLLVVLFMAVYYHRCGLIADFAMLLNLVITLGIMCAIGTTLSLPGIAGIVLTVGMAVDANVLIYERLREEMSLGKSMKGAISAAYSRAFATIFDSHTTTLISAIILIWMGTGPVKGFGVTLTIGVALSLFTALVVTRLIFDYLLNRGWLNKVGMMHIIKNPEWDFMKWTKLSYIASAAVIVIGMGYGIFVRGGKVMGQDFAGGDSVTLNYTDKVGVDQLRDKLDAAVHSQTGIQYEKGLGPETLKIVAPYGMAGTVTNTLAQQFPTAGFSVASITTVGPSVGEDIQKSAVFSMFLSLFGILLYVAFRYEFSFSIGAVVAVVHDVFLTLGIFFLSGRQLSAPIVAAVLTIIGFSLNDKVVIFDRIREDLKLGLRGTFTEIINKAVNQTLSRTIITSGTVFLSTMSLFLFGGGVIKDFAFTFLVGIISGTYSSIFIACALVLWWHKGERPKTGMQSLPQSAAAAGSSPAASAAAARTHA